MCCSSSNFLRPILIICHPLMWQPDMTQMYASDEGLSAVENGYAMHVCSC